MQEGPGHCLSIPSSLFIRKPKLETIELIGDHFLARKVSWFNEYHFLKLPSLKPKYKALLGGKDGPTSKTA
jgi:hypothetical protein